MDATPVARVALPTLLLAFAAVLMVWPVVRLRRATGAHAVTLHRRAAPGERAVAVVFLLVQLGAVALTALFAAAGPGAVGARSATPGMVGAGIAAGLAGLVLVAVAQREMGASFRIGIDDTRTPLVVSGVFGAIRNPIFTGLGVVLAGMVLIVPCVWSLALFGAGLCAVAVQARLEERHLLAMHGDDYRRYASRTGRFVPGVGRLRSAGP